MYGFSLSSDLLVGTGFGGFMILEVEMFVKIKIINHLKSIKTKTKQNKKEDKSGDYLL